MPRLRKLRKKQKFQYDVNRRKLNEKRNKLPRINCDAVRKAWDDKKSSAQNLTAMGLVADPNQTFSVKNRQKIVEAVATEVVQSEPGEVVVADALEEEAKDAYTKKKAIVHPLPPEMAKKLCSLLDKHGEDYEAMSQDPTNYYQETPAQLRSQINRFKKIPQQWLPYLKTRGLVSTDDKSNDNEDVE